MTEAISSSNVQPEIGQPSFLRDDYDSNTGENTRWVGIRAIGADGSEGEFLLWQQFTCNLDDPRERYDVAVTIARIKIGLDVNAVIGPPVHMAETIKTGKIVIAQEQNLWALYVEADKRKGLSLRAFIGGLDDEMTFRKEKPVEFDEAFQNAKKIIPSLSAGPKSNSV